MIAEMTKEGWRVRLEAKRKVESSGGIMDRIMEMEAGVSLRLHRLAMSAANNHNRSNAGRTRVADDAKARADEYRELVKMLIDFEKRVRP